jgi:hypothetical protein
MAPMSESFVDLTYRGLSLGRRVKLSEVRPTTGYVEMPAPMPVGTQIGIITDDTVALDAMVVEIHEQVSGSERPAGMVVKPRLDGDAGKTWWQKRVQLPEPEKKMTPVAMLAAVPPPTPVLVHGKRMTNPGMGVPEIVDDGVDTGVMDAVEMPTEPVPPIQDDGKQTVAMDAVDLKALGLSTSSQEMPAVKVDDDEDSGGNGNGERPSEPKLGGKKKRRRR